MPQRGFGLVPDLIRTDPSCGPVRELDAHIREAEVPINAQDQIRDLDRLGRDLLRRAEYVRIILSERANPHESVQRARRLVTIYSAKLGQAQRQFAVAAQSLLEHLNVTGAVHGLEGKYPVIGRLREKHVLAEGFDVPGLDP